MAAELKQAGLSRVNISLDTLDRRSSSRSPAAASSRRSSGIEAALEAGFNPVKDQRRGCAAWTRTLPGVREALDRPLHVRFIEYMPVGELQQPRLHAAGTRTTSCRARLFGIINARPGRRYGRARGRRRRPPARLGAGALFQFPNAQGTVGFISRCRATSAASATACASRPTAAAPVLVLGRRVRPAHRAALGATSRPPAARVRAGLGRQARRAPRQGRNRTGNVPNWRLRGTNGLPVVGTCRCCERAEARRLRAIPRARVPRKARFALAIPEGGTPRPFSLSYTPTCDFQPVISSQRSTP